MPKKIKNKKTKKKHTPEYVITSLLTGDTYTTSSIEDLKVIFDKENILRWIQNGAHLNPEVVEEMRRNKQ